MNWFSTKYLHTIITTSSEKSDPWTTVKPQSIGVCVCVFLKHLYDIGFWRKTLSYSCVCWFAQALSPISSVTLGQLFHHLELLTEVVLSFAGENSWETI